MSKYYLIKTKYRFLNAIEMPSFSIVKGKTLERKKQEIEDFFNIYPEEPIVISVGDSDEDHIAFYDIDSIFGEEVMEVLPLDEEEAENYKFIFGKDFGLANFRNIYKSISDSIMRIVLDFDVTEVEFEEYTNEQ